MNQTIKQVINANPGDSLESGICNKKKNIMAALFVILLISDLNLLSVIS
jgi:hypothetical protein